MIKLLAAELGMKPVGWFGQEADRHAHCYPTHKTIRASSDALAEGFKAGACRRRGGAAWG